MVADGKRKCGERDSAASTEEQELFADGLETVRWGMGFLKVSRSTLYALMDSGHLVFVKLGRVRRIPRRALIKLAASNLRGGWKQERSS